MASNDKDIRFAAGVDSTEFDKGMAAVASSAKSATTDVESSFKRMGESIGAVQKMLLGLTAVIAGGAAFKSFINQAADWDTSAGKMAKQLGITTENASTLNVALNHLGIDSGVYTDAAMKLSKSIQTNGQAFDVLGVKTRELTGAYRPVTEVMADVNKKLLEIKNPIEQNIAGQQIYGRGWSEIRGILRVTEEAMEAAEKQARELGLIVGPEGAASARQYKEQMRDLDLVSKSIAIQFGNALLPIFTKTGAFMAKEGPAAGQAFALVLESVAFAASSVWLALKDMGDGLGALVAQAAALLSGDMAAFKAIGAARDAESAKNEAAYEKLKAQFGQPLPATPIKEPDDSGPVYHFKEKDAKDPVEKSRAHEWDAELAEMKLAFQEKANLEGSFAQYGKAAEQTFWAEKLALTVAGSAENIAVRRKMADLGLALGQEAFQHEIASLQTQEAAFKNNMAAKLVLLDQQAVIVKQRYGEESKEYEAVQKQIVEAKRQGVEQQKQIDVMRAQSARDANLAEVQAQQQLAQLALELGTITQQEMLTRQAAFESQKNAVVMAGLKEREQIALNNPNPVELARIHAEKEQAERQHQLRLGEIRKQAVVESQHYTLDAINSMGGGFQRVFQQAMQGSLSLRGVMQGLWQAMGQAVTQTLAKMAADWTLLQLKNLVFGETVAASNIASSAAQAGAAGVASFAAAPWPIDMGAPAFGAEMAAAAASFGAVASASGGYDIPGSVNPLTQLHASEMVLPAKHADVIRSLADGGADGAGGGDVHLHINATDAQSVARLFRDNGAHLVAALKLQRRNLAF